MGKEQIGNDQRGQKDQTIGQGRGDSDKARPSRSESAKSDKSGSAKPDSAKSDSAKSDSAKSENEKRGKDQAVGESRRDRDQTRQSDSAKSDNAKQDKSTTTGTNTRDNNTRQGQTTGQNTRDQNPARGQNTQQSRDTTTGTNTRTDSQAQERAGTFESMSGRVQVNAQQQTRLQQSVLNSRSVARVNTSSINFRINAGIVVPRSFAVVSVAAYPALIDIYPDYRGYNFFVVEDEIVILDRSRRIVDVVPAGPRARHARGGSGSSRSGGDNVAMLDLTPDEIRVVQRVLIDRGFMRGEADGILGADTRAALITFQRRQGFQTTGSIDIATVNALGVSNRISATRNESTTVGQGQGNQQPAAQQNTTGQNNGQAGQTTGQANAPAQQNPPANTGQSQQNQPSASGQAGSQQPAGQTTGQAGSRGTADQSGEPKPGASNSNPPSGQANQNSAPAPSSSQGQPAENSPSR